MNIAASYETPVFMVLLPLLAVGQLLLVMHSLLKWEMLLLVVSNQLTLNICSLSVIAITGLLLRGLANSCIINYKRIFSNKLRII